MNQSILKWFGRAENTNEGRLNKRVNKEVDECRRRRKPKRRLTERLIELVEYSGLGFQESER